MPLRYLFSLLLLLASSLPSRAQFGRFVWQRAIGTNNGGEQARQMIRCRAGGYLLCGSVRDSITTIRSTYVVKLDEQGQTVWERRIDPDFNHQYEGVSIAENRSGQLLVATSIARLDTAFRYDARLDLLTPTGLPVWNQVYASPLDEGIYKLKLGNDGHFVGLSVLLGQQSAFKVDSTGTEVWRNFYPYDSTLVGDLVDIIPLSNGYLVAHGFYLNVPPYGWRSALTKTDENGRQLYRKPGANQDPRIRGSAVDRNGNILLAHLAFSRLSDSLNFLWTRTYRLGNIVSVAAIQDGNALLLGYFPTSLGDDLVLAKVAPSGAVIVDTTLSRPSTMETPVDVVEDPVGNYVLCGNTNIGLNGQPAIILAKLRPWTQTLGLPDAGAPSGWSLFPNPATEQVTLSGPQPLHGNLTLRDALGRLVRASGAVTDSCTLSLAGLPAGLYFLQYTPTAVNVPPRTWRVVKQ